MQTNQDIKTAKNPLWMYGEKPYHYALKDAVRDVVDAGLYGYALDLEFIEEQRDALSRLLDRRAGKI